MPPEFPNDPRIAVTSTEPAERKHLVQPYAEEPVVEPGKGRRVCDWCGNNGFRRSRLRGADAVHLLTFTYPVRCTRCGQRQFVSWIAAVSAFPPRPLSAGPEKGSSMAKNWVEASTMPERSPTPEPAAQAAAATRRGPEPPPATPTRRSDPNSIW